MGRTLTFDRDDALKKAMLLFWEHGYQGSSMKKLEAALSLRPGSLYHSFGSKDQLYIEALNLYANELVAELDAAISNEGNLLDGLECCLTKMVTGNQKNHPSRACLVVKTLLELGDIGGDVAAKADEILQAMENYFVVLLDAAKARGEITQGVDSHAVARHLQVQIIGIRGFAQRDNVQDQLPSMIRTAIAGLKATFETVPAAKTKTP